MRDLHRGDIYEAKIPPSWEHPNGGMIPVMILQNDAGEIPCQTATVLRLNKCNKCSNQNRSFASEQRIQRLDKRQLKDFMGRVSRKRVNEMVAPVERELGRWIPETIDAP